MEEDALRALLTRLSRPHPSGGRVVERAGILASGAESAAVISWIYAHGGTPEEAVTAAPSGGLHGSRLYGSGVAAPSEPSRYVLPADALA